MQKEIIRGKHFTRRALLLAGGQVAMLATLAGRMYYLQVVQSEKYQTLAEDNRISLRLLPPPRGRILDRFDTPLAINRLFPFMWGGFTLLAAAAIAFLWLLGGFIEGAMLNTRAVTLQWVLTVACFPAVSYLLMRIQRRLLPS